MKPTYGTAEWVKQKGLQGLSQEIPGKKELPVDVNDKLFPKQGLKIFGNASAALGILRSKFLIPPFSVLNAREGDWQTRKKAWLRLGIQSELGRAENLLDRSAALMGITDPEEIEEWNKKRRKAKDDVCPGGSPLPLDRKKINQLAPGGSPMPAMDYSKKQRGQGNGKPIADAKVFGIGDWMQEKAGGDRGAKKKKTNQPGGTGKNSCWLGADGKALGAKYKGGLADDLVELRAAQKEGETTDYQGQEQTGTSIFDPVLCELSYRWFCPPNGHVLDPFAGGSVRGVVASILGRRYTGIDLRQNQLDANQVQADAICKGFPMPRWVQGDALDVGTLAPDRYDLVFTCPPYGDLERYSDDPKDLSAMDWQSFRAAYYGIIAEACALLKNNRFACIVVGDYRDENGNYRNFVSETIRAFLRAGLFLYNSAILVTAVGSLPIRVTKQFNVSRKLGTTHQHYLTFLKGDAKKAAAKCNG